MRFEVLIYNDEVKCFHVVIHGTQRVIVMGHHSFKDRGLIKRQWATHKNKQDG
jgi:hypothetical protein